MSSITQLKRWLFGSRHLKVQIVGGEGAGKTTLLYTFKFDGKPYQEPSALLDYNFEIVQHYPRGWEFAIYDVGEVCSSFVLRHGIFHFMSPETLVWYIHDCSNSEVDGASLSEYIAGMKKKGAKYMWCILSKQDLLPPEERERKVSEYRTKLETILKEKADPEGIKWFMVADLGWNLKQGDFVRSFVKGVTQKIVEMDKEEELNSKKAEGDSFLSTPSDEELRARVEVAEIKEADIFYKAFMTADLTSWNHLDHLQAGYLIMLKSIEQKHGMLKCASTFLEHLERLRETRPDVFRNTAHFTMTAFWLIQLRTATFTFQYDVNDGGVPTKDDFRSVLIHTPSLMNTRLWMLYYTKEVLFAPQARAIFVMPDIQSFPQVTKPLLKSLAEGKDDIEAGEGKEIEAHEAPDTLFIGPNRLIRWAFEVVQNVLSHNLRRGAALKDALAGLQASTLKLRAKHPKLAETGDVSPYSETQAYFWIQYVHGLLSGLNTKAAKAGDGLPADMNAPSLNFEQFQEVSPVESSAWRMYYSQSLWESVEARLEFVNPDKKPLPNVIEVRR